MRSQQFQVQTTATQLLQASPSRRILFIHNAHATNVVYLQTGASAGNQGEAYPLQPNSDFVLDPVPEYADLVQGQWWAWSPSGVSPVIVFAG
jgi:hypothetical protein